MFAAIWASVAPFVVRQRSIAVSGLPARILSSTLKCVVSASTFASHSSSVVNESRPSAAPGWAAPPPGPTNAQITWLS